MRTGAYGLMLVALGIFVAILGGYLLNAQTVTSCETEWSYVTEIDGAFQGETSDMIVEYSPPSNVTGWSWKPGYNDGYISGVDWRATSRVNSYGAYDGNAAAYSSGTLSLQALGHDGSRTPDYSGTLGPVSWSGPAREGSGLASSEAVTILALGDRTIDGAFAAPMRSVVGAIQAPETYSSVTFSLSDVSGEYPAFAVLDTSYSMGRHDISGQTLYNAVLVSMDARAWSDTAQYFPQESSVRIGDSTYPVDDVSVVWGHAQFNGTGGYSDSCGATIVYAIAPDRIYVDPAPGMLVVPGEATESQAVVTVHEAVIRSVMDVELSRYYYSSEVYTEGSVYATTADGTFPVATFEWVCGESGVGVLGLETAGGDSFNRSDRGGSTTITFDFDEGTVAISCGDSSATVHVPNAVRIRSWEVEIVQHGSPGDARMSASRPDGSSSYAEGAGRHSLSCAYTTMTETTTTHRYSHSYWNNNQANASVTFAFQSTAPSYGVIDMILTGDPSGATASLIVVHGASGQWYVELNEAGADVGKWPAIEVQVSSSGAVVRPLGSFTTFLDYSVIGVPVRIDAPLGLDAIRQAEVDGSPTIRLQVVSTEARITGGGLYLRDAALDLASAFPEEYAVSLVLRSAARYGDGITVSSGGSAATIPVNGDKALVGDRWVDVNGLALRWMSPDAPTVDIGNHAYPPSIYHRGQTLAAGKVWAISLNGLWDPVELIDAPAGFAVELEGVWAPAVSLYDGVNSAGERTELMPIGEGVFRWDKDAFLLTMMAVCVVGGVVGSYFGYARLPDWALVTGAVGVIWLLL